MQKPFKSVAKRTTLEPLSVEEALSAPAVEGMSSFLNIRPEELLYSRQLSDFVRRATPLPLNPDTPRTINDSKEEANISSPGLKVNSDPGLAFNSNGKLQSAPTPSAIPAPDSNLSPGLETNNSPGSESYYIPGLALSGRPG